MRVAGCCIRISPPSSAAKCGYICGYVCAVCLGMSCNIKGLRVRLDSLLGVLTAPRRVTLRRVSFTSDYLIHAACDTLRYGAYRNYRPLCQKKKGGGFFSVKKNINDISRIFFFACANPLSITYYSNERRRSVDISRVYPC